MRTVWTFPGQLTEYPGMTGGLLEGSAVLERNLTLASEVTGIDVARICREGPEARLHADDCAALAVVAVGASAAEQLQHSGYRPDGVLGYSLGMYTAAVVSGAISTESAFRLVSTIAEEGERLFPPGEMSMAFVTGLKVATLETALREPLEAGEIAVTNINSQAQLVLAGRTAAVEEAIATVRPQAIRCERLPISRPYHSPWMAPVARAVERIASSLEVRTPKIPLFDHRDGTRIETAQAVRNRLSGQLTTRLDWNLSIGRLASGGASVFVEMPPGSSTTRMVRWIARDATAFALDQADDRERFLARAGSHGGVS